MSVVSTTTRSNNERTLTSGQELAWQKNKKLERQLIDSGKLSTKRENLGGELRRKREKDQYADPAEGKERYQYMFASKADPDLAMVDLDDDQRRNVIVSRVDAEIDFL